MDNGRRSRQNGGRQGIPEICAGNGGRLIYNEQHAPAAQWFSERGWTAAEATALGEYLDSRRTVRSRRTR